MNSVQTVSSMLLVSMMALMPLSASAQGKKPLNPRAAAVVEHWTPERIKQATPRDMVIDERGLGYIKQRDGYLKPHGHQVEAVTPARKGVPSPFGKPSGGTVDTDEPEIIADLLDPAEGATIGSSYTFKATVTDASGVSSVTFKFGTQSFPASNTGPDNVWSVGLKGFSNGPWSYEVVAKDNAGKGGNTASSGTINFTVDDGSSGGTGGTGGTGGDGMVTEAAWDPDKTGTDAVTKAAGRIYFEMPTITTHRKWGTTITWYGYVCSGTVANDGSTSNDRSIIITAAHCVYDDVNKKFARNVLFIPNQNATTGSGTDGDCGNDPMGCWMPSFGVVDADWTTRTFPANIPWDYAYYVVDDIDSHSGTSVSSNALDVTAGALAISFSAPSATGFTHALGYSHSKDPSFRYCAENLATEGSYNWWLNSCGLSGGASGGPWIQTLTNGDGPIISVNSWGYSNQPGMAGPKLSDNSAACRLKDAKEQPLDTYVDKADGQQGYIGTGASCS